MTPRSGNIGRVEQLLSLGAGAGLIVLALLRRGSPLGRIAGAAAGLSLVSRGASGYCAIKGAATGQTSLRDGLREQFNRVRSGLSAGAQPIDTLQGLYVAELQELHSAEAQLCSLLEELPATLRNAILARQIEGYNTEVRSRREDLYRILSSSGANPRQHSDQAMAALLLETRKVSHVSEPEVREAALLASLQRVIHFKIAGYGTVATYAKMLDRPDEASRLAEYGDRDKQFDAELSRTAHSLVNPQARMRTTTTEAQTAAAANPAY